MSWTYYRQVYPNGVWLLFREAEDRLSELFNREDGWVQDPELEFRKMHGEVDSQDIITEAQAQALIDSLPKP